MVDKFYENEIVPSEGEIRFITNRNRKCEAFYARLHECKMAMLESSSDTMLPCVNIIDDIYQCGTDNQFGKNIRTDLPEYARVHEEKFYDCYFTRVGNLPACREYMDNVFRSIYRKDGGEKLKDWILH
mmetsp:Transcript_57113/g.65126  ORF Transcript_57113/g.65126 Transcript_57113/m.65126 type:complete len:128 (+) Transcript_57113:40-423(+)